jgi:uncharacterized membrane protein (DUF485 family)
MAEIVTYFMFSVPIGFACHLLMGGKVLRGTVGYSLGIAFLMKALDSNEERWA